MADWRFGRGWSGTALKRNLEEIRGLERNFDPAGPMSLAAGWRRHASETTVGREPPGAPVPGGAFERARDAVARYEFSDPRIVRGHFDPAEPLEHRRMLLELKALGFRFLAGVAVGAVRERKSALETEFGFRYDTLAGHIESGWEWFLLTKSHATGEIRFRIEADWRPGDFPNAWSRWGFRLLGRHYQRRWSRRAHERLRRVVERGRAPPRPERRMLHEGPERIQATEGT